MWFEDNKVQVPEWLAQSPDLNPIEHLWCHLKRQLSTYDSVPNGVHELWDRISVEWEKIPTNVYMNLISSMPKCIACVIKAKGALLNIKCHLYNSE